MALVVIALAVILYALVSRRLATTPVTAAMLFMLLGVAIGPQALALIESPEDRRGVEFLLEVALALVLFVDALAISSGDWRAKRRLPARLLLVGMPLTMVLGWVVARALFPGLEPAEAALVGICLAPTDAALGQAVVTDPRVPAAIRQALNVESGLNDGLALPFLTIALAAALEAERADAPGLAEVFARSLLYAAAVGAAVGWLGARTLAWSRERGWMGREWSQIATLSLVLLAFGLADVADGSGFIATWVAGVSFGRTMGDRMSDAPLLAEDLGSLLATVSFLGFGAIMLGPILGRIGATAVLYAVLSLTVARLVPVAVSLLGTRLRAPTYVFAGWFGPRGLASIVFGLLIAEEALPHGAVVVDAIAATVGLSVVLHGATAVWGAARYGDWFERIADEEPPPAEAEDVGEPTVRRRLVIHGHAHRSA